MQRALFVLGIEWATQRHYVESVQDDQDLASRAAKGETEAIRALIAVTRW